MSEEQQSETKKFSAFAKGAADQFWEQEVTAKVVARAKEIAISFAHKDKDIDNTTWLANELVKYGISEEKASAISNEIISTIQSFNSNVADINKVCVAGKKEEQWLNDFVDQNLTADIQQKGEYLAQVSTSLEAGNKIAEKIPAQNTTPEIFAEFQEFAQTPLETPANPENWNFHTVRTVTDQVSQQAELMNAATLVNSVVIPVEQNTPPIFAEMEIFDDSETGDFNLKMISSAAMKVAGVVDNIPFLNALPVSALTNIACIGVESVKNLINVARGKIPAFEAVKKIGRAAVAAVANFIKSGFPATLLAGIPAIGLPLSVSVGGYLRSLSAEKIQEKIYAGIEKVKPFAEKVVTKLKKAAEKVTTAAKNAVKTAKAAVSKVIDKVFNWFSW